MMTPEMKQLILECSDCCLVFGRPESEETPLLVFILEQTDEQMDAVAEIIKHERLHFAGVLAYADGKPVCKCTSAESLPTMFLAGAAFARRVAEGIKAAQSPRADSTEWLKFMEKLVSLEDSRPEKFGPA